MRCASAAAPRAVVVAATDWGPLRRLAWPGTIDGAGPTMGRLGPLGRHLAAWSTDPVASSFIVRCDREEHVHDEAALIEARIQRVLGHSVLWEMVGDSHPFEVEAWEVPGEPVTLAEALDATFTPFAIGSTFSRPWGTTWFRLRATVPTEWEGAPRAGRRSDSASPSPPASRRRGCWRRGNDGAYRGRGSTPHRTT